MNGAPGLGSTLLGKSDNDKAENFRERRETGGEETRANRPKRASLDTVAPTRNDAPRTSQLEIASHDGMGRAGRQGLDWAGLAKR